MKRYKVILTESEMRKLNEVRRDVRAKRLVLNDDDFITVNHINKSNYKKYVGRKVNVTGDVNLQRLYLRKLPITFGTVGGDFDCLDNKLTSLIGCPTEVIGNFYCSDNKLTSLKGCPHKVGGSFVCSYNNLTSLAGCPREVMEDFYCCNNRLTSLSGCPHKVGRDFWCCDNKLTSLKGCPSKVGGDFWCSRNNKKFTENNVENLCEVNGSIYL